VDGRGVPLSITGTAANVNDGKRLDAVLSAIVVKRKRPPIRRNKHLGADAGYRSAENLRVIADHGYIGHVVDKRKEIANKRRDSTEKVRRRVVEVCHSGFERFRKLLVGYEKLERSFAALNHFAAAIIAVRKVPLSVDIIFG
jgi:putative transposase